MPRFDVLVFLRSMQTAHRIRLKVRVRDGEPLATLTGIWKGADWTEREVWDMFGIRFEGHPDLRRILLDPDWVGHPLLKSYAVDTPHPPYR
jgi:NADH-quinone oxidoreductase subunit C